MTCKNIRFSSLFATAVGGETSAAKQQKFHTDDANQCLHNKCGSHGVQNKFSNFASLLDDFGKVLCSSANELDPAKLRYLLYREDYISTNIDLFC